MGNLSMKSRLTQEISTPTQRMSPQRQLSQFFYNTEQVPVVPLETSKHSILTRLRRHKEEAERRKANVSLCPVMVPA